MKKLLIVLLGLASLNVYANGCGGEYQPATGTCRIIDSSGRQILYNVGKPQSSIAVTLKTNQALSISMSLQDTVHGLLILKQVFPQMP